MFDYKTVAISRNSTRPTPRQQANERHFKIVALKFYTAQLQTVVLFDI